MLSEEAKDSIIGNLPPNPERVPFDRDLYYNISKEDEGEGEEESLLLSNHQNDADQEVLNNNSNYDSKMNLRGEMSRTPHNRENPNLDESQQDKDILGSKSESHESDEEEQKAHFKNE